MPPMSALSKSPSYPVVADLELTGGNAGPGCDAGPGGDVIIDIEGQSFRPEAIVPPKIPVRSRGAPAPGPSLS